MHHYFRNSTITTLMIICVTSMAIRKVSVTTLSFNELLSHGIYSYSFCLDHVRYL